MRRKSFAVHRAATVAILLAGAGSFGCAGATLAAPTISPAAGSTVAAGQPAAASQPPARGLRSVHARHVRQFAAPLLAVPALEVSSPRAEGASFFALRMSDS